MRYSIKIQTMGFFGNIFRKSSIDKQTLIDSHVCPNCWGKQDYDGKFKDYVKDRTKGNINHDKGQQKAFIEQFVETRVTGIKLSTAGDKVVCKACNAKF